MEFIGTVEGSNCAEWQCLQCGKVYVAPKTPVCLCEKTILAALKRLGACCQGPCDDIGPAPEELTEYYAASDAVKSLAAKLFEADREPNNG